MTMYRIWFVLLFVISSISYASAREELTPDQQRSKENGLVLYNLHHNKKALPLIELAARAGDSEAQYYAGEVERQKAMFMTAEAQQWYEKAAEQGDVYAMLRLASADQMLCVLMENCAPEIKSPQEWAAHARVLAKERAKRGDGEAMFQMYLLNSEFDWLLRSAEVGFPEGQDWLGVQYREGKGFFLIPGNREKEMERLFRLAAEAGYVPAMSNLRGLLSDRNDNVGLGYWTEVAAKLGDFGATTSYGAWSAHTPNRVGFPLDMVKGYGLIYLLAQAEPGSHNYGERKLKALIRKMTPEQIEAGKAFAKEWKKTHPPLSRFLPKYGY